MTLIRRLWVSLLNFLSDNCLDLSAIVTFYSVLSLAPLLFLLGTSLNMMFGDQGASSVATAQLSAFIPVEAALIVQRLSVDLREREELLWIAFPAMVWVGTSCLSALEYAVNVAFATAPKRNAWHSRLKAFCVLAAGWVLLGAALLIQTLLPGLTRYRASLGLPEAPGTISELFSHAVLLVASFLIFGMFYKVLPRGHVQWRHAARGALLAVLLWDVARRLFGGILLGSTTYGLLTGALAGLVAFLLWIYTAVAIMLAGAEFTALLNGNRDGERGRPNAAEGRSA